MQLIELIKNYSVVMPELIDYLKIRGYNPGHFFTQMDLSLQFIIIFEFLLQKYDMVMITTPNVMGVRQYVDKTSGKQDVIFVEQTPDTYKTSNTHYLKLIDEAFKYIQNTPF